MRACSLTDRITGFGPVDRGSIPRAPAFKMVRKEFLSGVSILVGTCIGAGILGIPYVVSKSGFLIGFAYLILIGLTVLLINLYLGEVILRTKGKHQLVGYAEKYLGKIGKAFMEFSLIFGVYFAIVAYISGVGQSLGILLNSSPFLMSILFSIFMAFLLWGGLKSLKRFEKWGVGIILLLLVLIFSIFVDKISISNLFYLNFNYLFLPFGVILFAFLSFSIVPEIGFVLKNKKNLKKVLIFGTLISISLYLLFTFVVVGFKGVNTPEIATLALGPIFIFFGIFTMFTSYFALGNALNDYFKYDESDKGFKSWFLSAILPIFIFLIVSLFRFFSFTKILSIGGVVSGGIAVILILLIVKKAKNEGKKKPEYSIPINWFIIIFLSLIFVAGIIREVISAFS